MTKDVERRRLRDDDDNLVRPVRTLIGKTPVRLELANEFGRLSCRVEPDHLSTGERNAGEYLPVALRDLLELQPQRLLAGLPHDEMLSTFLRVVVMPGADAKLLVRQDRRERESSILIGLPRPPGKIRRA